MLLVVLGFSGTCPPHFGWWVHHIVHSTSAQFLARLMASPFSPDITHYVPNSKLKQKVETVRESKYSASGYIKEPNQDQYRAPLCNRKAVGLNSSVCLHCPLWRSALPAWACKFLQCQLPALQSPLFSCNSKTGSLCLSILVLSILAHRYICSRCQIPTLLYVK